MSWLLDRSDCLHMSMHQYFTASIIFTQYEDLKYVVLLSYQMLRNNVMRIQSEDTHLQYVVFSDYSGNIT